jgi:hypothetical protein
MEKQLNRKLLLLLNSASLAVTCYFARNTLEVAIFCFVAVSALLNHIMMANAVYQFLTHSQTGERPPNIVFTLFVKMVILFGSIGLGVHFIGDRIIVPLINYMAQLAILGICLKKG